MKCVHYNCLPHTDASHIIEIIEPLVNSMCITTEFHNIHSTQRASPKIIDKSNFLFSRVLLVSFGGSELWPVHIATNGFNLEHKVYVHHLYCIVLHCSEQSVRLCTTQKLWYTLTLTTGNGQRALWIWTRLWKVVRAQLQMCWSN